MAYVLQHASEKKYMPETLDRTFHGQIIGGMFSNREKADEAVAAFREMSVPAQNIQLIVQLNDNQAKDVYAGMLTDRGSAISQADYYDQAIRKGKILVVVYDVMEPGEIIDVFDRFGADFNPSGSRNLRQDVVGMTTGAVVGAAALGTVGGIAGGPVGAAAGGVAGAVLGGGTGAIAGKAAEHSK